LQETREKLLFAIRRDDLETVKEILSRNDATKLARAKNYYGRLHPRHKLILSLINLLSICRSLQLARRNAS
jgi:hypothetical protein